MSKVYRNSKCRFCPYCGEGIFGRRAFLKHKSECAKEHGLKIDVLGRVINPLAGKHAIESFKKKVEAREAKWAWEGKHHSEETKKKISINRIKFLESNNDHGLKWYTINGIKVQGSWEKKFAEYLNSHNIRWTRTTISFLGSHRYTPDFYCPNEDVYFEVKGFRRDRDIYKMHLVLREHPNLKIKMIEKRELKNLDKISIFNLPNFEELYPIESVDMTKFENVWKTGR